MSIREEDPAFPTFGPRENSGMSLRDYFAGQALTGLLADLPKTMYGLNWQENAAEGAYALADAMLAERVK